MKISLWVDNEYVTTLEIPPFNPPPGVVMWGSRIFHLMPRAGIDENGCWRYVEVFAYYVPPGPPPA